MTTKASPKSACASPGRMAQGHEHLLAADPGLPNVILHDRVAARISMLGLQPLEDPLGRVPLLLRPPLVFFQYGVDDALPRRQPGPPHRLLPPIPRRQRILQHLAYRLPRQPKLPGHRPPALALDKNRPPHPRIDLHGVHTSGVPRRKAPLTGGEPCSLPLIGSVVHGTRMWRWTTFIPPRHAASAAQYGLFFHPARTTARTEFVRGLGIVRKLHPTYCGLYWRKHGWRKKHDNRWPKKFPFFGEQSEVRRG